MTFALLATDSVARRCTCKSFALQVEFSGMLFHEDSTKKFSHFLLPGDNLSWQVNALDWVLVLF